MVLLVLPAFFVAIPSLSLWHRAAGVALTTTNALSLHANLTDVVRFASLLLWLVFAGATLLLVLGRLSPRPRLRTSAFIVLTLVVVTVDLFRAGVGQNPAISLATARQPVTGAIRYLQTRRPARFAGLGPVMPGAMALRYGLDDYLGEGLPDRAPLRRVLVAHLAPGGLEPGRAAAAAAAAAPSRSTRAISDGCASGCAD